MADRKPYRLSIDAGVCDVVDRATNENVGYVRRTLVTRMWHPFVWRDAALGGSYGGVPLDRQYRYRQEAIEAVWENRRG
jgi:hypothetical protein